MSAPRNLALVLALALALALGACDGQIDRGTGATTTPRDPSGSPATPGMRIDEELPPDPALVEVYLRRIAPMIVGRSLTSDERALVAVQGVDAVEPILELWADEPGFALSARTMVELALSVSGTSGSVDFTLPGNLVEHVVLGDLPWSQILTSESCYDGDGNAIECDTGAPYAAGVLATRAYMISRAGRFNLTRAATMMEAFACRAYPMDSAFQPRIERERLLPMFRAESPEEQMDARAAGGFGNGFECYTCHGQFSLHSQLYVKFDSNGRWIADATGELNPEGQLGESFDGLMASHLVDPAEAASEQSQILGQPVANLAEAARVLAQSPEFRECAAHRILSFGLDLDQAAGIDPALLTEITEAAVARSPDPTYRDLVVATFSSPKVIATTIAEVAPEMTEETP